jgi:ketosteroid isomerase-like protein
MKTRLRSLGVGAGIAFVLLGAADAYAQQSPSSEIPLQHCDRLPVVVIQVDKVEMHFLVDTAATSMLDLKSFSTGQSKQVQISSWNGTKLANAKEVFLPEIQLGNRRLVDVKLPAVDLSAIAKACGGPIDGIFGVDLLEQLNVTIDLRRSVARLGVTPASRAESALIREMGTAMEGCSAAFNAADADHLAECLDPDFVLISPDGEYHGRENATNHFRQKFLTSKPPVKFSMTMKDQQAVGDVVWTSYDYTLESPSVHFSGHGMMLCRKAEDRWYILSMHESANELAVNRSR